jgi:hypothetical protein
MIDLYGFPTRENCFGDEEATGYDSSHEEPTDEDLEADDE